MPSVQIDSWQVFPAAGGDSIAFDGDRMAIAGPARLNVWQRRTRLITVDAPSPAPGVPRFAGQRVFWGPGFVDLGSGKYTVIPGAQPALRPGGGERPHVYAWSPRGDLLLASFNTGDPNRPARVTLFSGQTGTTVATLWDGTGIPPQAAWLGERAAVVGFGDPRVFDQSGTHLADLAVGGATIACIAATADESRLIAVDLNRSVAWIDAENWTVLDRWHGPWLHGSVSPDGRFVAVLEPWGKLHFACVKGDRFELAGEVAVDNNAIALALTLDAIATVGGGEARVGGVRVDCDAAGEKRVS